MRFRKLRVAWSLFWGVACILLVVLWVRSYSSHGYWKFDENKESPSWRIGFNTFNGTLTLFKVDPAADMAPTDHHDPLPDLLQNGGPIVEDLIFWKAYTFPTSRFLCLRLWFPTLLFAIFAAAPWASSMQMRFSLLTLIIATTLVAVVLGIIVYATR